MSSSYPTTATTTDTLWDAAERLRTVRRAHERFLALWAVDRLLDAPAAAARAWADIDGTFDGTVDAPFHDAPDATATPDNHAFPDELRRRFFRGGLMDD